MLAVGRRVVSLAAVAVLALVGLTACSPSTKGVTGLSVDENGQLLAVLAWCTKQPPDTVLLDYLPPETASASPSGPPDLSLVLSRRSKYAVPQGATRPAMLPLVDFPPELAHHPDTAFRIFAVEDRNSFNLEPLYFRLGDLAALVPGGVMVDGGAESWEIVSADEFVRRGQEAPEC
ncbi:hypothetical protein GA0074692_0690 [Micromonospora pallida]|uniref:Lipoprotein n=2 Tax=Micromonospora pallida TaxID=145854 RepID=A0A1C6RRD7_9ACTN|nr:hypothetical protein GA0074692_0690 [Micromonospora pallida]